MSIWLSLLALSTIISATFSGSDTEEPQLQAPSLETVITNLRQDPDLRHASFGICIRRMSDGGIAAAHDANRRLIPASTAKLITTAVALEVLGPDYRFETGLDITGSIDTSTGVLDGDIIIRGGGDPTLGSDHVSGSQTLQELLDEWVSALHDRGLRAVSGSVIGDASFLNDELPPSSWSWNDLGNYYAAPASGLTIHDNLYRLTFTSPGAVGAATRILRSEPPMSELQFENEVVTGPYGSRDEAYIHGSPFTTQKFVRGTLPPGRGTFTIKGAIPDPARFAAQQLISALRAAGVSVANDARTNRTDAEALSRTSTRVYTHRSPTLRDIVERVNKQSDNLYAEHLLKLIGKDKKGIGSTSKGIEYIEQWLSAKGVSLRAIKPHDGSGLSRSNTLSAGELTKFLVAAETNSTYSAFKSTLAVAGKSGTLRSVGDGTRAEGRVFGKSGSLKSVRCYAGYFTALDGKDYAFAMLSNYFSCSSRKMKQKWENLMAAMVAV